MVGNRPDWCISRQRFWGVPMTLFVHKQTGELHPDTQALFIKVADKLHEKSPALYGANNADKNVAGAHT
jgi:isoleucyl-tRNA synthetase